MKTKYKNINLILAIIIFIVTTVLLFTGNAFYIDKYVFEFVRKPGMGLYNFFKVITNLGGKKFIVLIILMSFLLYRSNKEIPISMTTLAFITTVINQFLKYTIKRPRPLFIGIIKETGYSFPSGHSMITIAIYGYIIYLINNSNIDKYIKYLLNSIFTLLIILIPISRVYLGVHFATDIIAGMSLSYIILHLYLDNKAYFFKK